MKKITGFEERAATAAARQAYAITRLNDATPSRTLTNATATGLYSGNRMGLGRPDANHQHASLPMGAQIVRCV